MKELTLLNKKLRPLSRRRITDEEVSILITSSLYFNASPWSVVADYFKQHVHPIDSNWFHDRLASDFELGEKDKWAYQTIRRFLFTSYRFGVNPLPTMRGLLPKWEWSFQEITEDEWDFNNPPPVGVRNSSGVTWTWLLTDYTKLYKVVAHLPQP